MIDKLTEFITNTTQTAKMQRLQRWVVSTRAKSYNALVLFNVWADDDRNKQQFIKNLVDCQRPIVDGKTVELKEALLCLGDSTDVEPFVCTTGLELWCVRVHYTLLGEPKLVLDGTQINMPKRESVKIRFKDNLKQITPVYNGNVIQLVTFWGTNDMPKIWDITRN